MDHVINKIRLVARIRSRINAIPGIVICTALCVVQPLVFATEVRGESLEYSVKAAFIYNFAKFIEWPAGSFEEDDPIVIGVLGRDSFTAVLDKTVAGKTVRERKIEVKPISSAEEALKCHILFIGETDIITMTGIIEDLDRTPVLTVSDLGKFAERGGMIQLEMDQGRVRFEINLAATERVGLKPSSQLLKLARIIQGAVNTKD